MPTTIRRMGCTHHLNFSVPSGGRSPPYVLSYALQGPCGAADFLAESQIASEHGIERIFGVHQHIIHAGGWRRSSARLPETARRPPNSLAAEPAAPHEAERQSSRPRKSVLSSKGNVSSSSCIT